MNDLVVLDLKDRLEGILQSKEPFPVDFDDAWQWAEYTRKDHALEMLNRNFEEGLDFCSRKNRSKEQRIATHSKTARGGHNEVKYFLTTDCFKSFCMMAGTEKGKEVRRYYLKIEKAWNTPEMVAARAQQMGIIPQTALLPGSKRPLLEDTRAKLEEKKAQVEKKTSQADLPLFQFAFECLEVTGNRNDSIDMGEAYRLYCTYTDDPLSERAFPRDVTAIKGINIDYTLDKTRLIKCKFKPNIPGNR